MRENNVATKYNITNRMDWSLRYKTQEQSWRRRAHTFRETPDYLRARYFRALEFRYSV